MELLGQSGTGSVSEISELLQVSQVTVRKDLQKMENQGLLRRTHGGAAICGGDNGQDPRMSTMERIAMAMYDEYCTSVGGKAYDGRPLPTAKEFFADATKAKQSRGWMSAASKALELILY